MLNLARRRSVDLLVEKFWKQGYLTVSRKFGTYLPEPSKVGKFEVDIIARYKKNYAIGITLSEDDFLNPDLIDKLNYLATRQTKYSNKKVMLFLGVPAEYLKNAKELLKLLDEEIKKNIKLFEIIDKSLPEYRPARNRQRPLFS